MRVLHKQIHEQRLAVVQMSASDYIHTHMSARNSASVLSAQQALFTRSPEEHHVANKLGMIHQTGQVAEAVCSLR